MKDVLAALGSNRDGAESFVEHKKVCEENKTKLETLDKESESKLSDAQQRVQVLQLTKDTVDQLATKVDEAERRLAAFQEHVHFLGDHDGGRSYELLAKDPEAKNEG